jgi:hypothetical protein
MNYVSVACLWIPWTGFFAPQKAAETEGNYEKESF